MFEKEAKEYAINMWGKDEAFIDERNNCKQDYIAGAEFGYNKANEWHKENPKVSMPLILIRYRCHVDNKIHVALGKYNADYGGNKFQLDNWNVFDDEVIAWKEIVLPELKESE